MPFIMPLKPKTIVYKMIYFNKAYFVQKIIIYFIGIDILVTNTLIGDNIITLNN